MPDGTGGRARCATCAGASRRQPSTLPTLAEHPITRGDRLDLVTARYLGDPTQFWRVCDANLVIHPDELVAADRIGERLRIPVPQA